MLFLLSLLFNNLSVFLSCVCQLIINGDDDDDDDYTAYVFNYNSGISWLIFISLETGINALQHTSLTT